jgi:cation transport ATPase
VIDEGYVSRLSPEERSRLARALAALDGQQPAFDGQQPAFDGQPPPDGRSQFRRRLLIAAALGAAVALAAWIGVLAVTLPHDYRAGGWRITWIGFDAALLAVFAVTAWAAWKRRQVLILCLVVLAALLTCDAWFDVTLDWETRGFWFSLLLALLVELPVAAMALVGARRLLRLTIGRMEILEGGQGRVPAFWRVPLFGDAAAGYRDLLKRPETMEAAPGAARVGADDEGAAA